MPPSLCSFDFFVSKMPTLVTSQPVNSHLAPDLFLQAEIPFLLSTYTNPLKLPISLARMWIP